MKLQIFNQVNFLQALKALFKDLKVPMNYVADEPTTAKEILKDTYKDNETFQLMDDVYFVGMVDDAAFEGNKSLEADKIKSDYDGILIFGVTLKCRPNGLLPTRSQLAEISRAFNREFYYTPVVVVFKYGNYLAFANTERLKYKQEWREGEKAGKVSLLRDIDIEKTHSGHERILSELQIPTIGNKKVDSFSKLYAYWQEVFSVSLLNKKFYQELSNWYFWATKHVTFPGEPTAELAHEKNAKLEDLLQEQKATNVIRMLTRLLFVWFIKEKKLIPEELFELDALQKDILNEISPYHERGMFKERNKESIYYKAILQNLFFATLNCPIQPDGLDKRSRGFRDLKTKTGNEARGKHQGIDYLLRYEQYFKNPEAFLSLVNSKVPFLNGGLFECLDDKDNKKIIDGYSDNLKGYGEQLIVPDYLFFGVEEETDLSDIVGIKDKKYKQAAVKGLINILKSYKFTITENTPIEEDVALDPELLGKVFENLLASYNPETKTTARKQTGSFYTPREIVNYMVDESLIAYLKNAIADWGGLDDETLDKELHVLTSFDSKVPFADNPKLQRDIISALSTCTILDPACGSGAFPMGILQKMVHILQKLDPDNEVWKEVQLDKARKESEAAFEIEDKQAREERLLEINEAFDQSINDPDYARKLFLIENCIYGVDIQPIATQISKLRFFISLVVEQKVNAEKNNFGIRPLPNLETKFVAANTLIGIKKDGGLFETEEVKKLENELKIVRHKIFSLKSKERKIAWREKDKELREKLSTVLKNQGLPLDAAEKLAKWDPYDQNASSPFFDSEWMFGIKEGFDVVIGNPPYVQLQANGGDLANIYEKQGYETFTRTGDIYSLFYENGIKLLCINGVLSFITSNKWMRAAYGEKLRAYFAKKNPLILIDLGPNVFETATVDTNILLIQNSKNNNALLGITLHNHKDLNFKKEYSAMNISSETWTILTPEILEIKRNIENIGKPLKDWNISIYRGITSGFNDAFEITENKKDEFIRENQETSLFIKPVLRGKDIGKYKINWSGKYLLYIPWHFPMDPNSVTGASSIAEKQFITKYPSVYNHLLKFKNELSSRNQSETGKRYEWYALQRFGSNFSAEFDKQKIIYQEMVQSPSFSFDKNGDYYCFDTARIITGENLKHLLAIFNSKLFFFSVKVFYGGGALGANGVRMKHTFFDKFPAIRPSSKISLDFFTDLNINCKSIHSKIISDITDAIVFNLYFPDHMKDRGIDVLEFVEKDIEEVMQGREFEKLSEAEKEQVIEALHATWSHPDNEVRNRIKLFAVRSPEILKPILES